jgi:hypothetical protein
MTASGPAVTPQVIPEGVGPVRDDDKVMEPYRAFGYDLQRLGPQVHPEVDHISGVPAGQAAWGVFCKAVGSVAGTLLLPDGVVTNHLNVAAKATPSARRPLPMTSLTIAIRTTTLPTHAASAAGTGAGSAAAAAGRVIVTAAAGAAAVIPVATCLPGEDHRPHARHSLAPGLCE